ncbi:hypothetical protein CLV78_107159 [Aliiruegeria haliotis]|uniref:Uncharacterized protein n=1 Tax=Aliiruegeria haliotis TaxID=1280846 RepID=A0A2T0RM19_9RHOB|nr:hypothetical protein CLV78_107159 [Aliiruegeria haliotis]
MRRIVLSLAAAHTVVPPLSVDAQSRTERVRFQAGATGATVPGGLSAGNPLATSWGRNPGSG